MSSKLHQEEKQVARQLWHDLKNGAVDAPERLCNASINIRDAILAALVVAMDTRDAAWNPFD